MVVDNGSGPDSEGLLRGAEQIDGLQLIRNETNLGIGAALNQGVGIALKDGFDWALTLDQDSEPAQDLVSALLHAYAQCGEPRQIAMVAPQVIDAGLGRVAPFLTKHGRFLYRRVSCTGDVLDPVTTVISSGALLRVGAWTALGGFREDFFMDYVDTEYCLRAQLRGYRVVAACGARLFHHLGDRRRSRFGLWTLYPTFHAPERWYTISRNRVPMLRSYALRFPHWLMYESVATAFVFFRMLVSEDQRGAKLAAAIRGTWDGLRGRMGKPSWVGYP